MKNRHTRPTFQELGVIQKVKESLSELGFKSKLGIHTFLNQQPDLIAIKKFKNLEYKIAVEIKSNPNTKVAVTSSIETMRRIQFQDRYDKLLVILPREGNRKGRYLTKGFEQYKLYNPTGIEFIELDKLENWISTLPKDESNEETYILNIFKSVSKKIISAIALNPLILDRLEWFDLERTIAEVFEGIGFEAHLTPPSKDGGKDVIIECYVNKVKKSYIIEIKHWRSKKKVGHKSVMDFAQVVINEKRESGLFLSTYGYSSNLYERLSETERKMIHYGDKNKIVELCKVHEKIKGGIYNPVSMEDIIYSNTGLNS